MSNAFDSVIGYEKIKRDLLRVVDMITEKREALKKISEGAQFVVGTHTIWQ